MSRALRNYVKVWAGVLLGILALTAALNITVDPYMVFGVNVFPALAEYRPNKSRIMKAEMVRGESPAVVVLGSSRSETGLDPLSPHWPGQPVYNLSLTGAELEEIGHVFDYVVREAKPRVMVLGIDLLMFNDERVSRNDFENSRFNPQLKRVEYLFANALSHQATDASFELIARSLSGEEPGYTPRGRHVEENVIEHRRLFETVLLNKFFLEDRTYLDFHYAEHRLDEVRRMAEVCEQEGIELIIFINPVHALQLEAIRLMGLWDMFERWKRDVVEAAGDVPLWDFTGYTGPRAERVPAAGELTAMRWYFESSHYKPALGELVISDLFSETSSLGTRLTAQNVGEHLAAIRGQRQQYVETHPDEIEWITELHRTSTR